MSGKCDHLRKCIGCGQRNTKDMFIRLVRRPLSPGKGKSSEVLIDLLGKSDGRGAYVCKNIRCVKKARKSGRIERSFSCGTDEKLYDCLEKAVAEFEE